MTQKIQLHYYTFPELLDALKVDQWKHLAEPVTRWKAKQAEAGLIGVPILGPLVVFAEADTESVAGRLAVTQVILNRAVFLHGAVIDIALLQPKQFYSLIFNDPSLYRVKTAPPERVKALTLEFQAAMDRFERGASQSQVGSATVYMSTRCWESVTVSWARGSDKWDLHKLAPCGQIGRYVFFAEV